MLFDSMALNSLRNVAENYIPWTSSALRPSAINIIIN
jgi:hypothetical protein